MKFARIFAISLAVAVCAAGAQVKTYSLPMEPDAGRHLVTLPCHIQGIKRELRCMLDTGASRNVVSERIVRANTDDAVLDMVTASGIARVHLRRLRFELGDGPAFDAVSILAPLDDSFDALLGQDFLQQFNFVTFDYAHRRVIFEGR